MLRQALRTLSVGRDSLRIGVGLQRCDQAPEIDDCLFVIARPFGIDSLNGGKCGNPSRQHVAEHRDASVAPRTVR